MAQNDPKRTRIDQFIKNKIFKKIGLKKLHMKGRIIAKMAMKTNYFSGITKIHGFCINMLLFLYFINSQLNSTQLN